MESSDQWILGQLPDGGILYSATGGNGFSYMFYCDGAFQDNCGDPASRLQQTEQSVVIPASGHVH
jgi:hypothetical protein